MPLEAGGGEGGRPSAFASSARGTLGRQLRHQEKPPLEEAMLRVDSWSGLCVPTSFLCAFVQSTTSTTQPNPEALQRRACTRGSSPIGRWLGQSSQTCQSTAKLPRWQTGTQRGRDRGGLETSKKSQRRSVFDLSPEGVRSFRLGAGSSLDTRGRGQAGLVAGSPAGALVASSGGWRRVITRSETRLLKPDWFLHFWRFFVYFLFVPL